MIRRNFIPVLFIVGLVGMLGCSSSRTIIFENSIDKYNYVVASADNNYSLTMPEAYDILAGTNYAYKGGILEADKVREFIDSLLIDTLIGFRADTVDLRNNYEYYYRFREGSIQRLVRSYYTHEIFSQVTVDTVEVNKYIKDHPDLFTVEEQVLVSHIAIIPRSLRFGPDSMVYKEMTPQEIEDATKEMAFDIRDSIDSKETFEEMAKRYSNDLQTAQLGGLVGWAPRNKYLKPFDSVAFSASPGDIVGPYRDKDGWQILYIDDYMPAGVPPLDHHQVFTALQAIQMDKSRDILKAVFDTLMLHKNIVYNEAVLDTNVYKVAKPTWAAIVNDVDTIDFGEIIPAEETIRNKYKVNNSTVAMKKELIDYLAQRRVIVQEAKRMGLDTLPDFVAESQALRHNMARLIVESEKNDHGWEPSQEMMQDYYNTHLENYVVTKPVEVQQIVVADSSLALFIRDQANAGVSFMKLAAEYYPGDTSVRAQLADLGWVGPEDVSKDFFDAAMITRVGEVSEPVKTEYGFHVIKVLDKKLTIPFDRARTSIRAALKEVREKQEIQDFKNGLRQEFHAAVTDRIYPVHLKPFELRENKS